MLYLLLGYDDFSKRKYIKDLAEEKQVAVEYLPEPPDAQGLRELLAPGLFAATKLFVIFDGASKLLDEATVDLLKASSQHAVFFESKLDKRKTQSQKMLKDKHITAKEFPMPRDRDLEKWIIERAKALGGKMGTQAASELAMSLSADVPGATAAFRSAPKYDLWQADNELKKLLTYTNGEEITSQAVHDLASVNFDAQGWDIAAALADKQPKKAYALMEKFFHIKEGSDEKGKVIQLNASLAEQFRSILLVQDFLASRTPEEKILEATGWKPGKLYIVKRLAPRFEPKKVRNFLNMLADLDEELKSTATPARVLLDLITAQIIV